MSRSGRAQTFENLMGELSLGFWVSLFNSVDELETLWRQLLKKRTTFPGMNTNRTRSALKDALNPVLELRNRVFHHEPIWKLPQLGERHQQCVTVLGWISPAKARLIAGCDRFPQVYGPGEQPFCASAAQRITP